MRIYGVGEVNDHYSSTSAVEGAVKDESTATEQTEHLWVSSDLKIKLHELDCSHNLPNTIYNREDHSHDTESTTPPDGHVET